MSATWKTRLVIVCGLLAVFAVGASLPAQSEAAIVTFGTPTAIGGSSDVSLAGTLHGQANFDNASSNTTVNTVAFTKAIYPGDPGPPFTQNGVNLTLEETGGFGSGQTTGSTGDASYDLLLRSLAFHNPSAASLSFTFTNLTIGYSYEFQLWSAQGAVGTWTINQTLLTAGVDSVILPSGTFVLGTFKADSPTQAITWQGTASTAGLINAIQIREFPTPEPSTFVLAMFGLVSLCVRQRRRR